MRQIPFGRVVDQEPARVAFQTAGGDCEVRRGRAAKTNRDAAEGLATEQGRARVLTFLSVERASVVREAGGSAGGEESELEAV
jgi:hypothetical protein